MSLKNKRGQTAIEYLTYFAFFLLIASTFSAFVFTQSGAELSKRSQERFKSTLFYVAQGVKDVNTLAMHADYAEANITLPYIVKGAGMNISDIPGGIIMGNTTVGGSAVYYYVKIGNFTVDVTQDSTTPEIVTVMKK